MRHDDSLLEDIRHAAETAAEYIEGLTLSQFLEDKKTQDAVIRQIEIMGEAA